LRIQLKKELSYEIWRLAGPIVLGMVSQTLMNLVDTAMVGRLGPAALAATGLGGLLSWMVLGTLSGLHVGVQAVTARRFGEGNTSEAGKTLDNGILIGFLVGSICTMFFSHIFSSLFRFVSNDPAVTIPGSGYIYYRLLSGLPFLIIAAQRGFFNGISQTRLHMRVVLVNNVLNVILNYALIFGKFGFPRMEAPGAGLATSLATVIGALYFLYISLNPKLRQRFGYYQFRNLDRSISGNIIRLAVPSGLQVLIAMSGYAIFSMVVARIGTIELAATNVCITVWSMAFLPGAGLGVAASSLIGQKLGEGKPGKAEEYGWESVRLGIIIMGTLGALFIVFPELIFLIFTDDQAVISAGKIPLRIIGAVQLFDAAGMVLASALQGAGMSRWVLKAEIAANWGFFIPFTLLVVLVLGWGLVSAWIVLGTYLTIYGMTVTLKFYKGKWKDVKI